MCSTPFSCSSHGNQLVFLISRNRLIFQFKAKQFIVGTCAFSLTEKRGVLVYRPLNIPETMYKYYEFFFKEKRNTCKTLWSAKEITLLALLAEQERHTGYISQYLKYILN